MSEKQKPQSKPQPDKKAVTKTQEVLKKVTQVKPTAPSEQEEVRMGGVTLVRR